MEGIVTLELELKLRTSVLTLLFEEFHEVCFTPELGAEFRDVMRVTGLIAAKLHSLLK